MVRPQTEILLLHQKLAIKMKTFMAAAFLLALFLPYHAVAKNDRVEGEIDISVGINCLFDEDGQPRDDPQGEVVSGTCDFRIETDRRFRKKNLRRHLKKSKSDDEFFLTFQDCGLRGDSTGDRYSLFDGVINFQDTMFTQDVLDVDGEEREVDTTFRTLSDRLRIKDQFDNLVAFASKKTELTIEEIEDGDSKLKSINKLEVIWDPVDCDAIRDVDLNPPVFVFETGP
jgi:hypothetical protein